jgi:hypothetical protein
MPDRDCSSGIKTMCGTLHVQIALDAFKAVRDDEPASKGDG